MGRSTENDWIKLRDAVVAHYRSTPHTQGAAAFLQQSAALARVCSNPDLGRARGGRKPVSAHVLHAVSMALEGPLHAVAHAFAAVEPDADWLQNPNYTAAAIGQRFLDGYGYVEFLGPGHVFDCADLRIGLLLLAPGLTYPEHAHPAEEVYHAIAGTACWWRGDGETGWREKPAGAMIHHPPNVRHATRTLDDPLLAIYCWGGQIGPHAALSGGDQT